MVPLTVMPLAVSSNGLDLPVSIYGAVKVRFIVLPSFVPLGMAQVEIPPISSPVVAVSLKNTKYFLPPISR